MKVLIADDSQPIRERIVQRLSLVPGVQLAEAVDTPDAIRQTATFMPDVAVLDIRMPGGGGIAALGEIKKIKPGTTVIIMTNYPYAQYRRKCLDAGADFFFDKSTEFEQVAEVVRELMQTGNVSDVARRTAAAQVVAAKEELEKATQHRRDMGILSLLHKPAEKDDAGSAYSMWEKTFDAMPDMVAIFDADHTIVRVNKAMADRLDLPAVELTGKKCFQYMHGTHCPASGCPHEALLKDHKEHTIELYDEHLGGWFEVSVSPIFEKNQLIGVIHVAHDITQRKKAKLLAQSTLDALSAHICIVDENGSILSVNRSWSHFAEENQLLSGSGGGENYLAVCDAARGPHKEYAKQFAAGLRAVLRGERDLFEMEYPCETEKEQLWFCGRVTPFPGEGPRIVAIAHEDITARRQADQLIKISEERYRQLFDSMHAGFALHEIICDEDGVPCDYRFLEANPAFEEMTGLKVAAIAGKTVKAILPSIEDRWIQTYGKVALTGEPVRIDDFTTALGRHYSVSAYSPGKGLFATVIYDVTEQRAAEDAIRRALDAAEESNRAKTQFLANMSHELRTPLNAIIGFSEILEDTPLNEEQLDYIKTIGASGEALLSLIADLLDLSKIEMGKLKVKNEPFSVRDVVKNSVALLSVAAGKKGLDLSAEVADDVPETLTGDSARLQQILINLLNNAIKFTDQGFVRLTLKNRTLPSGSRRVEFAVQDSGKGMSEAVMERIFQPFQQGDNSDTREYGGSGLGLAICKNLVQMMGGTIHVESREGEGSCFRFGLLARSVPLGPIAANEVRSPWRGRTICVWTDDPADMRTAEVLLERIGALPRYKTSIDEIKTCLTVDAPADAVLCNLDIPGLVEQLPEFRKIRPDVPWIGFSTWSMPPDEPIQKCFSACIDRPLSGDQLYGALVRLPESNT